MCSLGSFRRYVSLWYKTILNQTYKMNSRQAHEIYRSVIRNALLHNMERSRQRHQSFLFFAFSRWLEYFNSSFGRNWRPVVFFCLVWRKDSSWTPWRCRFGWRRMFLLWCLGFRGRGDFWEACQDWCLGRPQARSWSACKKVQSRHILQNPSQVEMESRSSTSLPNDFTIIEYYKHSAD